MLSFIYYTNYHVLGFLKTRLCLQLYISSEVENVYSSTAEVTTEDNIFINFLNAGLILEFMQMVLQLGFQSV